MHIIKKTADSYTAEICYFLSHEPYFISLTYNNFMHRSSVTHYKNKFNKKPFYHVASPFGNS